MTWLALLVLAAAGAFALSHWLRLPVIPLLILLGFVLANAGIPFDAEALDTALDLGLAFLVFTAGAELDPQRFSKLAGAVVWVGVVQFLAVGLAGLTLAFALGYGGLAAIFLSVSLATSSTLVVVRRLQVQPGAMASYGRLVVGVLLVQDVIMILVMVTLGKLPEGIGAVMRGLGGLTLVIALALAVQRWVAPAAIRIARLDEETWLLMTLSVLFLFAGAAVLLGLPPLAGAFLAGFSLSAFPISGLLRGLLGSLSTFFLAIFFAALGAKIGIPSLTILLKALACAILVLVVTPLLVTAVAEWKGGLSSRKAISSGLLLAQTSEFALVLGLLGLHEARLPPEVFSIIALVAVITMTLTPFLADDTLARRLLRFHPLRHRLETVTDLSDHVLILGFGSAGMWVTKPLIAAGHQVVVVDHDPVVVEELQKSKIPCLLGDGSDEKMLERAGARKAKVVLATMSELPDSLNVIQHVRGVPVIIRVFEKAHAEEIERVGGIAVLNSLAAADTFMEWYESSLLT